MNKKTVISLCFIFVLFFASTSFAANWYVDNQATGANDGTSWANAWTALAKINWNSIDPGDTIYISGGDTSQIYHITDIEYLQVKKSGTSWTLPITIKIGQDDGHNGVAIFDLGGHYAKAFRIYNKKYIVVNGEYNGKRHFKFQNAEINDTNGTRAMVDGNTVLIKWFYTEIQTAEEGLGLVYPASGTEVAYNYIHDIRQEAAIVLNGSPGGAYDAVLVHDNIIHINNPMNGSGYAPDGIQGTSGISVYNNDIHGVYGEVLKGQHQDLIQALGLYWKIYNNTFENGGNSMIMSEINNTNGGFLRVYNNVFAITDNRLNGYQRGIDYGPRSAVSTLNDVRIYNNTFVDIYGFYALSIIAKNDSMTVSNVEIKNNIFYNDGNPGSFEVIRLNGGNYNCISDVVIDHNLINAGANGSTNITCNGSSYSQSNGQTQYPLFVSYSERTSNNNFHLSHDDVAAKNKGADLSTYFTTDKDGVPRPQGSAWDIGAYEYEKLAPAEITTLKIVPPSPPQP